MKKYFLFLLVADSLSLVALSQNVGIGTNNPQNKLHIAGGLRLDTLVGIGGNGILIHNTLGTIYGLKFTGNVTDVLRGDGSFGAGSSGGGGSAAVWMLNGNSGTNPATDFIGTTDAKPLLFRVNNLPAGQIHQSSENTSFGLNTLKSNTTGGGNTAIGIQALYSNTEGAYNTGVGRAALYSNTKGYINTATGGSALYSNTEGSYNTADGSSALYYNTMGSYNTAMGEDVLYTNTTGSYNTGIGYYALNNTTTAQYNTAIGYKAGQAYDNGYNNVFVGANTDVNGAGYYNVIAIGQGTICTGPSEVLMGNSATTTYRAYAAWSNISDGRYKKNIKEDVPGLSFINKLRPVTYNLDATGLDNFLHKNQSKKNEMNTDAKVVMNKGLKEKEQIRLTGFVAQEVEKSAKELGFDFSGIDAPKNENDVYGLRYSEFVVPLVKAVQEQQIIIEKQQHQIDELKKELDLIKGKLK